MIKYYNNYKLKKALKDGMEIGEKTRILGIPKFGSEPYLIRIGKHCTITSGVRFITHDGATWLFRDEEKYRNVKRYGKIEIYDNCFIGINSIIMPDVAIGPNSIIAAGSVVTKNVPAGTVYGGVPAKFLMTLDDYKEKTLIKSTPNIPNGINKKEKLISYFWEDEK